MSLIAAVLEVLYRQRDFLFVFAVLVVPWHRWFR